MVQMLFQRLVLIYLIFKLNLEVLILISLLFFWSSERGLSAGRRGLNGTEEGWEHKERFSGALEWGSCVGCLTYSFWLLGDWSLLEKGTES